LDGLSGLSHLKVEIVQDHKDQVLAEKTIPLKAQKRDSLAVAVNVINLGLHDGNAILKITATDHSLFQNQNVLTLPIKIDTLPPQINLLSKINYVNQGGTGYVSYQLTKPITQTGIYLNAGFIPGNKIKKDSQPTYAVYFPVPLDADPAQTKISLFARDEAGNETNMILPFIIKRKSFRQDKMMITDQFLQRKIPEFQAMLPDLRQKSLVDVFIYVNTQMRKDNFSTIQKICEKSTDQELWEGNFLRMTNAAPMALFGDKRYYFYHQQSLGESVHSGVDLASTAMAPVEAANKGIVVFTGALGIYGNAVIIDHGMGIFSLYAHLSSINTSAGKTVSKGEKIGNSGMSGLAGGDHLHFSMIVNREFVNPQEWWDAHWIKDNLNR